MKLIRALMNDRDLFKDFFTSIGYFVFIAGIVKFAWPIVKLEELWPKLYFSISIMALLFLATLFWYAHVALSITKVYFPEYRLPGVDKDARKMPLLKVYTNFGVWFHIALVTLLSTNGFYLLGLAIEK